MADHLVKLIHARELEGWERLPAYEKYSGKTLAQYRAEVKARKDFEGTNFTSPGPDPLLFVSHRWESLILPDPDGRQLRKLKALKDCYLIYDYTSFPQDMTTAEAKNDLTQVLAAMNSFIDNLLVLSDQDYMNRGWCLYEYLTGSLTHRIVCDEINSPALVRLRNLVATQPNPPGIGSTYREAVNAKNQFILETVNAILPLFDRAGFTVLADREIVQRLLIDLLQKSLPRKQEYMPYVGEWKTMEWTRQELAASFKSKLTWEALQYDQTIPIFEPVVPDNLPAAVAVNYKIEKQPQGFGNAKYNWDFSGLTTLARVFKILAGILIVIILWALYRLALWIFMR